VSPLFPAASDLHPDSLTSASACSSQNRMSISRYIVAAVAECSCSCRFQAIGRHFVTCAEDCRGTWAIHAFGRQVGSPSLKRSAEISSSGMSSAPLILPMGDPGC